MEENNKLSVDSLINLESTIQILNGKLYDCTTITDCLEVLDQYQEVLRENKRLFFDIDPDRNSITSRIAYILANEHSFIFHLQKILENSKEDL